MDNYKSGGYKKKYIIQKKSGNPVDPNAEYFILRIDKDPHARKALAKYISSVSKENKELANDLTRILTRYNQD